MPQNYKNCEDTTCRKKEQKRHLFCRSSLALLRVLLPNRSFCKCKANFSVDWLFLLFGERWSADFGFWHCEMFGRVHSFFAGLRLEKCKEKRNSSHHRARYFFGLCVLEIPFLLPFCLLYIAGKLLLQLHGSELKGFWRKLPKVSLWLRWVSKNVQSPLRNWSCLMQKKNGFCTYYYLYARPLIRESLFISSHKWAQVSTHLARWLIFEQRLNYSLPWGHFSSYRFFLLFIWILVLLITTISFIKKDITLVNRNCFRNIIIFTEKTEKYGTDN